MDKVIILGAGLAGSEAAWQLAERGIPVKLVDMKPSDLSPAHEDENFAELVCSNSLRSTKLATATGLLKHELKLFSSLIMEAAEATQLPAGNALAVDRAAFPKYVTKKLSTHPNIEIVHHKVNDLSELGDGYQVIATGPLTGGDLFSSIEDFTDANNLFFFDAAAPLLEDASINKEIAFSASRYEEGEGDYLNCPLNKEEYLAFHSALLSAEKVEPRGFEKKLLFEACKPVEALAEDGIDTLRFGPMKPVGLPLPSSGKEAYAIVQLRQDNFASDLWNMVGFQTRLKFPEQKRVFQMIPGLENASFARYGVMHRNSFICSPNILDDFYRTKSMPKRFFAGQITGVEGYLESTASGLVAALAIAGDLGEFDSSELVKISRKESVIGGLQAYVSQSNSENFQPMKANFSLLAALSKEEIGDLRRRYKLRLRGRAERRTFYAIRSLESLGLDQEEIVTLLKREGVEFKQ